MTQHVLHIRKSAEKSYCGRKLTSAVNPTESTCARCVAAWKAEGQAAAAKVASREKRELAALAKAQAATDRKRR
jgi:hypothetical protein